jgi:hypothetical protein
MMCFCGADWCWICGKEIRDGEVGRHLVGEHGGDEEGR